MTAGEIVAAQHGEQQHGEQQGQEPGQQLAAQESHLPDRQVLEGPFTTRALFRLDDALRRADTITGLMFSVYVGPLSEPTHAHAEQLLWELDRPRDAVLLAVSPNQRVLEIVTGPRARRKLPDRDCELAAASMTAAFAGGDLAGGILSGVSQLATRARG